MNIKKEFKRISESTIGMYVVFFIANLLLVFFISFIFWTALVSGDPCCAGYGKWIFPEIPCPTWSCSCIDPPFIEVFIMCAIIYFVMIIIIFVIVLFNNAHQRKRIDRT